MLLFFWCCWFIVVVYCYCCCVIIVLLFCCVIFIVVVVLLVLLLLCCSCVGVDYHCVVVFLPGFPDQLSSMPPGIQGLDKKWPVPSPGCVLSCVNLLL